jgi:hypothetical protein
LRFERGPVRHIGMGKEILQILRDADILEYPNRRVRLDRDQDIDIAGAGCFIATEPNSAAWRTPR